MFADPEVRAILCVRGGYGTGRLLGLLDYTRIRANPKIFMGYSDITALHCALLRLAKLVSFHGPMLNSDFAKGDLPELTFNSLTRTLMHPEAPGGICQGYPDTTVSVIRGGRVSGRLVGGNLSLLCSMIGTTYQPSFRDKILFLEDVEEAPYR